MTMLNDRIFASSDFIQESDSEPIRSVVTSSEDATVIMWTLKPGQQIKPHVHPDGQDTWYVLSGSAEYISDTEGTNISIKKGDIVIAHRGQVHGTQKIKNDTFSFLSVVSPSNAGFELNEIS